MFADDFYSRPRWQFLARLWLSQGNHNNRYLSALKDAAEQFPEMTFVLIGALLSCIGRLDANLRQTRDERVVIWRQQC